MADEILTPKVYFVNLSLPDHLLDFPHVGRDEVLFEVLANLLHLLQLFNVIGQRQRLLLDYELLHFLLGVFADVSQAAA